MPRRQGNATRKATQVSASLVAAGKAVAKAAALVGEMKGYIRERAEMTKAAQATHGSKNRNRRNRTRRNKNN
jgi:hypothetical protein